MKTQSIEEVKKLRKEMRQAVADYMYSEGCSCCRSVDRHEQNTATLAKLLRVPKYSDGSGYDFERFETKEKG